MEYTNEAFWFFYWIDFFDSLATALVAVGVATIIIGAIYGGAHGSFENDEPGGWKKFATGAILGITLMVSSLFVPPKEAFYAGAAYEIVQTEEVNQTLLSLKTVIDQKLKELTAVE